MKTQYNQLIHQALAQIPSHSLPLTQEVLPQAGLIIAVDPTETYFTEARIVYIGYSGNCARRWRQIFYGKGQNNVRAYVQQCYQTEIECDAYLQQHCQLKFIACANEQTAKIYAQQLVHLVQNDHNFQPSASWLGVKVNEPPLKDTKLWQSFAPQSLEFQVEAIAALLELLLNEETDVDLETVPMSKLEQLSQAFHSRPYVRVRQEWRRNPYVKALILERAEGRCELCEQPAPFRLPNGQPYLEVHHVIPLEAGGPDTVDNCVALCPNCHREVHYAPNDLHKLYLNSQQKEVDKLTL